MPEAAVNEDSNSVTYDCDIWFAWKSRAMEINSEAQGTQNSADRQFRPSIPGAYSPHYFASLGARENVHVRRILMECRAQFNG